MFSGSCLDVTGDKDLLPSTVEHHKITHPYRYIAERLFAVLGCAIPCFAGDKIAGFSRCPQVAENLFCRSKVGFGSENVRRPDVEYLIITRDVVFWVELFLDLDDHIGLGILYCSGGGQADRYFTSLGNPILVFVSDHVLFANHWYLLESMPRFAVLICDMLRSTADCAWHQFRSEACCRQSTAHDGESLPDIC